MNRNYYCKVNSQEEANKLLKVLSNIDENILTTTTYIKNSWNIIGFHGSKWCLLDSSYLKKDFIEVPASELIDYVTGKKLDKDALLEEAKRRYPVGTKFKSVKNKKIYKVETDSHRWYNEGIDVEGVPWVYLRGNWAEIVEEPKVETKFEVGKWYKMNNSWYAKFKTIHGSGNYWQYSEAIDINGVHRFDTRNLGNVWKSISIASLEDLSEIQQYLPDGHPDKIKEVKEEVKPIEEWSTGYVVSLIGEAVCIPTFKVGDIAQVTGNNRIKLLSNDEKWNAGKIDEITGKIKWFPTLQEAQKFSDELLGKSKTDLRVEDLVEGEIYVNGPDNGTMWCYIIKYSKNFFKKAVGLYKTGVYSAEYCNYMGDYTEGWLLRLATPDEKKWLNTCIKQDKFIPKEDLDKYDDFGNLMKSKKYPEYIKCIEPGQGYTTHGKAKEYGCINYDYNISLTKGRVYKVLKRVEINPQTWGFVLQFADKHYLLGEYGAIPSNKEAYEAQFKKDEKFKDGDWLVYIKHCGLSPSLPIKIGDVRQMIRGSFGTLTIYGAEDLSQYFRKALPHEIPVENSVKQNPWVFEECKFPVDIEKSIIGTDPIVVKDTGVVLPANIKKTPDLIDKSKVEVKIKRTKVKQIKL